MKNTRLYTIIGALVLIAGLTYGLTTISVGKDTQKSEAWKVRCEEAKEDTPEYCEMHSSAFIKESGVRLFDFAIGYPPGVDGQGRGVVSLPLGMKLIPGGTIKVDEGEVYRFSMDSCNVKGCYAFIDMNEKIIGEMRGGQQVTVSFHLAQRRINLQVPLDGFSRILDTLK